MGHENTKLYRMHDIRILKTYMALIKAILGKWEVEMPQVTVNVSVEELAKIIHAMNDDELETLIIMLEGKAEELIARKKDIENTEVSFLTRDEIFDV